MSAPLNYSQRLPSGSAATSGFNEYGISIRMYGPALCSLFEFMYSFPRLTHPNHDLYRYGASALAAAANSGSHLSPFAKSFSLLYSNSSLVSVAYSALGAAAIPISPRFPTFGRSSLTFHNSVNGTALLTEPAINTLRHINIISRSPSTPIFSLFSLYHNTTSRANRLAKLACDTSLLACRISPQGMFSSKAWRNRSFLEWVIDRIWRSKELF